MVALLAIEQLTGVVRVPPLAITTSGSASAAQSIESLIDAQDRAMREKDALASTSSSLAAQIALKDEEINNAQTANDDPKVKALKAEKDALTRDKSSVDARIVNREKAINAYAAALQNPGISSVHGASAVEFAAVQERARTEAEIIKVAAVVEGVVKDIISGQDDVREICVEFFGRMASDELDRSRAGTPPRTIDNEYRNTIGNFQSICKAVLDPDKKIFVSAAP